MIKIGEENNLQSNVMVRCKKFTSMFCLNADTSFASTVPERPPELQGNKSHTRLCEVRAELTVQMST